MKEILQFVKAHGECLNTEIAQATGMPLADVPNNCWNWQPGAK